MPFRFITYHYRQEGITPQEFRDAWEIHMGVLVDATKIYAPIECVRHYPARVGSGIGQRSGMPASRVGEHAPVVLLGEPEHITWDCIVECVFRDELHFRQFWAHLNTPEIAERVHASEEKSSDPNRMQLVVLGETLVSKIDES
jgi:hypothetical protein